MRVKNLKEKLNRASPTLEILLRYNFKERKKVLLQVEDIFWTSVQLNDINFLNTLISFQVKVCLQKIK